MLQHKINLDALIGFMDYSIPKHNQTAEDFAEWRKNLNMLEEVYFTWCSTSGTNVTLGVNLVKPSIWVYSKLDFDSISPFLVLSCALRDYFIKNAPNPSFDTPQEHAKPPYYKLHDNWYEEEARSFSKCCGDYYDVLDGKTICRSCRRPESVTTPEPVVNQEISRLKKFFNWILKD